MIDDWTERQVLFDDWNWCGHINGESKCPNETSGCDQKTSVMRSQSKINENGKVSPPSHLISLLDDNAKKVSTIPKYIQLSINYPSFLEVTRQGCLVLS